MQEQKQKIKCEKCKSLNVWKCGFALRKDKKLNQAIRIQIYQCKDCGTKFRGN